jgi:hypothetical protein
MSNSFSARCFGQANGPPLPPSFCLGKCVGHDPGLGGGSGIGIQSSQELFPPTIVTFFGIDLIIGSALPVVALFG